MNRLIILHAKPPRAQIAGKEAGKVKLGTLMILVLRGSSVAGILSGGGSASSITVLE